MSKMFGAIGIWYAAPVSDFIATVLTFILIRKELNGLKKMDQKVQEDEEMN